MTLSLVLTYHWFDQIVYGDKRTEYRKMSPHWLKMIWERKDRITHVRFRRGYTKTSIKCPVANIDIGPCPYDGWDDEYYRIYFQVNTLDRLEVFI